MLAAEVPGLLSGTASRFAVQKRFGALGLTRLPDHDTCLALLSESFRYAALYELRSNLFDYHLEEDRLVTADNWKDTIRFHFVQYQHIYEQALDGFYAAVLSRKLLRAEFSEELKNWGSSPPVFYTRIHILIYSFSSSSGSRRSRILTCSIRLPDISVTSISSLNSSSV